MMKIASSPGPSRPILPCHRDGTNCNRGADEGGHHTERARGVSRRSKAASMEEGDDGVIAYRSAGLEETDSTFLVVRWRHSVQEVRRNPRRNE